MNGPITNREIEEIRQVCAFFDEALVEVMASPLGRIPDSVLAAMMSRANIGIGPMAAVSGPKEALAMVASVASVAYFAGRKAERAGLVHVQPPDRR